MLTLKKKRKKNVNLKIDEDEREMMRLLANKYAEGNLTRWIRYAALNFRPKE